MLKYLCFKRQFKLTMVLSSLLLVACHDVAKPITKSRADLKSEIGVSSVKQGAPYSQIYSYDQKIIVSVKDKGLEVVDNSDPLNPVHEEFINLPGAKDVVIHEGTLITQQYADMVFVSIDGKTEISRINNMYDFKDYLVIPDDAEWYNIELGDDEVVIGYTLEEGDHGTCFFFCL